MMGEAKRKKLRDEYPVELPEGIRPNPAYQGILIPCAGDGSLQLIGKIEPVNMILPNGETKRSLFFHDDRSVRAALSCNGDTAMLFVTLSKLSQKDFDLLKAVASSANELEDQFPGDPDNVICVLFEAAIRDSIIKIWNAVSIEYSLGIASHEQFWKLCAPRIEAILHLRSLQG